jgi:hypothetical protein
LARKNFGEGSIWRKVKRLLNGGDGHEIDSEIFDFASLYLYA